MQNITWTTTEKMFSFFSIALCFVEFLAPMLDLVLSKLRPVALFHFSLNLLNNEMLLMHFYRQAYSCQGTWL